MNLPNKLTMLRILLIPVFMLVLYWGFPGATWAALAVFVIAGRKNRPEVQFGNGFRKIRRPAGG